MIRRLILRGYFYSGLAQVQMSTGLGLRNCTILLYHGVEDPVRHKFDHTGKMFVSPKMFEKQICFLKNHFNIISLSDVVSHIHNRIPFPPKTIAITFDDGYKNNYQHAYPILRLYRVPFTIFLTTGYIGNRKKVWWHHLQEIVNYCEEKISIRIGSRILEFDLSVLSDKRRLFSEVRRLILSFPDQEENFLRYLQSKTGFSTKPEGNGPFLSWKDVQKLAMDPLVELGSHTISHPPITRLSKVTLEHELIRSKETLEEAVQSRINFFAYPYGNYKAPRSLVRSIRAAGYQCALTALPGKTYMDSSLFNLKRISISGQDSWPIFISKILGLGGYMYPIYECLLRTIGLNANF